MRKRKLKRLPVGVSLLVALAFGLSIIHLSTSRAIAQTSEKMIIRRLTILKYPLGLSVEYQGKALNGEWKVFYEQGIRTQTFPGDADWLKNLSLQLKNVSDQPITFVEVFLIFPETARPATGGGLNLPSPAPTRRPATVMHRIRVGVDPEGNIKVAKLRLLPGEVLQVQIAPEYSRISNLVRFADLAVGQINQMEIVIQSALFGDGTLFQAGMMYGRDPKDSQRWIPIGSAPFDRKPNQ